MREITFENPGDGQVYVYLTSELTLAPGLLVLLDKTRWDIEPVLDESKTTLPEKKSWATSTTAKAMQAQFVAIVHNLLLRVQDQHAQQGVVNTAETERKQNASQPRHKPWRKNSRRCRWFTRPFSASPRLPASSSAGCGTHWHLPTSRPQAWLQLQRLYAKL